MAIGRDDRVATIDTRKHRGGCRSLH